MSELDELLAPIDEERPGGADVGYEPVYSKLTDARDDALSPEGEGDFEDVVELASQILAGKSKDLTVAIWLAEAELHLHGFDGLRRGLMLVHGLLDGLWEHLFPAHPEDRAWVLDFMGDGFKARDERYEPVKFVQITSWGHHLHHFEAWSGIRKDSFGEAERAKKKKAGGDDDDPRAPRADNFEQGLAETSKAWYRERAAALADCLDTLSGIQAVCQDRFGGEYKGHRPGFTHLREELQRAQKYVDVLIDKKLETDPDPPEAQPAAAAADDGTDIQDGSSSPTPEGSTGAAAPSSGAAVAQAPQPTDTADAQERIIGSARFLRRSDPSEPTAYLVLRALRWGELRAGGGAIDARLLDAPPTELRKRLKTLLLNGEWAELLDAAEEVMATPCGRGWLDLQRYALTAVENLGAPYRAVGEALRGELAALLRDLPELPEKTLMDDTPTANRETLEWLSLLGLAGEEESAAPGGPDYDRERVLAEATHEKALEWVASGNPNRGVELLMKRADREESARARFITESLAASVLVDAGRTAVARPILEQLVDQISKRKLEEWESAAVVARPLGLLYRCLPANDRKRQQLYDEICRLDPVLAIDLEGAPSAASESRDEPTQPSVEGPAVDPGSPDRQA